MSDGTWGSVTGHPAYRDLCYTFVNRCNLRRGDRLADLGAGTGIVAEIAFSTVEELDVVAVEPDPALADEIESRIPRATVVRATFETMTEFIEERSFDAVIAANSIHLAAEMATALTNIHRILRPGGSYALLTGYHDKAIPREDQLKYAQIVRKAHKIASNRSGGTEVTVARRGVSSLDMADLTARLNRVGLEVSGTDSLPMEISDDLARDLLRSEMLTANIFDGVSDAVAGESFAEAADTVLNNQTLTRQFAAIFGYRSQH